MTEVQRLARQGEANRLLGRYTEALADFDQAIALSPTYAWALAHRGETQLSLKQYRLGLIDFNQALKAQPGYVWALAHRGAAYRLLKQYQLALTDFDRVLDLQPDYAWALFYRGRTHELLGNCLETLADFERAIALDATIMPYWRGERGAILSFLGRYDEALAECKQALLENENDQIALYYVALITAKQEGVIEAQLLIDKARNQLLSSGDFEPHHMVSYRLAGLAALGGDCDQALHELEKALLLDDEPLQLIQLDFVWQALHLNPNFQALIAKMTQQWAHYINSVKGDIL